MTSIGVRCHTQSFKTTTAPVIKAYKMHLCYHPSGPGTDIMVRARDVIRAMGIKARVPQEWIAHRLGRAPNLRLYPPLDPPLGYEIFEGFIRPDAAVDLCNQYDFPNKTDLTNWLLGL